MYLYLDDTNWSTEARWLAVYCFNFLMNSLCMSKTMWENLGKIPGKSATGTTHCQLSFSCYIFCPASYLFPVQGGSFFNLKLSAHFLSLLFDLFVIDLLANCILTWWRSLLLTY